MNQTKLARIFGVTPRTIRDYHGLGLEEHRDPETGKYDLPAAVSWRLELEWNRALDSTSPSDDIRQGYEEARARKTTIDAQLKEDELQVRRGALIPADEVLDRIREPLEAVDAKLKAARRTHSRSWSEKLGVTQAVAMDLIGDLVEDVRSDLREVFESDDRGST